MITIFLINILFGFFIQAEANLRVTLLLKKNVFLKNQKYCSKSSAKLNESMRILYSYLLLLSLITGDLIGDMCFYPRTHIFY